MEVRVYDRTGLDVPSLIHAIEASYVTPHGRQVKVRLGQGLAVDGVPPGTLRLVDR